MVWKDNLIVDDDPKTLKGFLDNAMPFSYSEDAKELVRFGLLYLDEKHFPKTFIFANFQCLRCGSCCKNYECVYVESELVKQWEAEGRKDILQYFVTYGRFDNGKVLGEICPRGITGCPLCRKVKNKPYYGCNIHDVKEHIPTCKAYLCSKSIPVAHLNFEDIDELIALVGLDRYYSIIEKDWGEEFDYSVCEIKTHAQRSSSIRKRKRAR